MFGLVSGPERVRSFIERRDSRRVKERSQTMVISSSNGEHGQRRSTHGVSKLADGSPTFTPRHKSYSASENRNNNVPLPKTSKSVNYGQVHTPELATIVASPFVIRKKKAAHHTTGAYKTLANQMD